MDQRYTTQRHVIQLFIMIFAIKHKLILGGTALIEDTRCSYRPQTVSSPKMVNDF